jgi:methylenetetrahydrofolate--tRNA-(uracil-5-)-methyltransferase
MMAEAVVIGGGLAGSEAAWQLAARGVDVRLYEMRPQIKTGAHRTDYLAELICSNSLGSKLPDLASGVLMSELHVMRSMLLECANKTAVPAGGALAVDRIAFARMVSERIESNTRIEVIRDEVDTLPSGVAIVASGPLTSTALSNALMDFSGEENLSFFDALSPIVAAESIDWSVAFRASRYERGEEKDGDYVNCPLNKVEYDAFVNELINAERIPLREFELAIRDGVRVGIGKYFEGCLPIEIIGERGRETLAFGPMRPVGLRDPRTGNRPYAVVQLRGEDLEALFYNLVGFQTNLKYGEQDRVFRMIPGLTKARFVRHGQMHRNTFINSPRLLRSTLQYRKRDALFFAGQITGIEGYLGSIGTGMLAGINSARLLQGQEMLIFPRTTMLGALTHYIAESPSETFKPMKANFGILPPLKDGKKRNRLERRRAYAKRSSKNMLNYLAGATI